MEDEYIRIAGTVEESTVDGPGLRYVIFTQGCPHKCEGCHNPLTHDSSAGNLIKIDTLIEKIQTNPLISGVTLSGGEPFLQAKKLSKLVDKLDRNKIDVIAYTGFEYEKLIELSNENNGFKDLISRLDILIDGKFDKTKKDELLMFRGSSNQRVIDCKKSINQGTLYEANISQEGDIIFNI